MRFLFLFTFLLRRPFERLPNDIFIYTSRQFIKVILPSRGTIYDLIRPYHSSIGTILGFEEWQKDASQKIHGLTVGFPNSTIICSLLL
jgi:hypothetical protein